MNIKKCNPRIEMGELTFNSENLVNLTIVAKSTPSRLWEVTVSTARER